MERLALGEKNTAWQRSRVDRFVMSRDFLEELRRRRSFDDDVPVDIWSTKHRHQKKYKSYLNDAFGMEPLRSPDEDLVAAWPCVPRKRPYLSSADSILDLPTYSWAAFPELIDWGSKNLLVAALGSNYHMFGWRNQRVIGKGMTSHVIQCCKFDPRGDWLLIGTDMKTVELHCSLWKLWTSASRCKCTDGLCSITAIDWSPTGNSFVTGCSLGFVSTFDRSSLLIGTWKNAGRDPVLSVRVSPDTRFVAIVDLKSPLVHILTWPSLKYHSSIKCNSIVKSIAWHPWRPALLAVGGVMRCPQTQMTPTVAIWDVPSSRLKKMTLGDNHYNLDVLLFSQRTGELVLSLWNSDVTSIYPKISQIVVMSDPYTVVDQSGEGKIGLDRIRTMVFSPDGTKLATATADEDLIIWNFLPEDKNKEKTVRHRRFFDLPVYVELVTQGFALR